MTLSSTVMLKINKRGRRELVNVHTRTQKSSTLSAVALKHVWEQGSKWSDEQSKFQIHSEKMCDTVPIWILHNIDFCFLPMFLCHYDLVISRKKQKTVNPQTECRFPKKKSLYKLEILYEYKHLKRESYPSE